ncbi:MAG: hypothetical protein NC131_12890, partial [Roseburia sp.]|nr:hypothetical protein [Roseburia sp.]
MNKITEASTGLEAFNAVAKQIGVKNISGVAQKLDEISRVTNEAAESQDKLNSAIENGEGTPDTGVDDKKITRATDAIEEQTLKVMRLQKEVANLKSTWLKNGTAENSANYLAKNDELIAARKELQELTEAQTRANMSDEELRVRDNALAVEKFRLETATKRTRLEFLRLQIATEQAGEQTDEYKREIRQLVKELDNADKIAGKLNKGSFSKFVGKIGRIALYRTIRRGLQMITQTFTGTIQAYAKVDDGINKTMSSITTSMTTIKYGLGSTIFPILQAIEPILKEISLGFANMANVINASMSETGYYTKINTDRLLNYNKATKLFDFDKFRSLGDQDASSLMSTEKVEDLNDELGVSATNYRLIYDIIHNIGEILKNVFGIVKQIVDTASPILTIVLAVADGILYIVRGITWLASESGLLSPILGGILGYFVAMGVTNFISWLKTGKLVTWFKNAAGAATTFSGKLLNVLSTTQALAVGIGALVGSIAY